VLYHHPPFAAVPRGEILTRTNLVDGSVFAYTEGTVLVLPAIHQTRRFSVRDQVYRTTEHAKATGSAPFQSNEGVQGVLFPVFAQHTVREIFSDRRTQLEAEADKVRREKAAEAAGQEQVIAAKAQEETMQHILPFKQKRTADALSLVDPENPR